MQHKLGYSHRFVPGAPEATQKAWREFQESGDTFCDPSTVHFIPALGGCFVLIQDEPRASLLQSFGIAGNQAKQSRVILDDFWNWITEKNGAANQSCSVMVIDDDPALLKLLQVVLQTSGCEVRAFTDARVALESIDPGAPPGVIVVDLKMPGMDGRAFVQQIRAKKIESRIIIASAFEAKAAQKELNAEASLSKPFVPEDLVGLVQGLASLVDSPFEQG